MQREQGDRPRVAAAMLAEECIYVNGDRLQSGISGLKESSTLIEVGAGDCVDPCLSTISLESNSVHLSMWV